MSLTFRHTALHKIDLTHCGLVTPYGDIDLGKYWLRQWLVAWRYQAITLTNTDLSSKESRSIHLCAISQGSEYVTCVHRLHLLGSNELIVYVYHTIPYNVPLAPMDYSQKMFFFRLFLGFVSHDICHFDWILRTLLILISHTCWQFYLHITKHLVICHEKVWYNESRYRHSLSQNKFRLLTLLRLQHYTMTQSI